MLHFGVESAFEIQAQSDNIEIIADQVLKMISAKKSIEMAAAEEILLTAGGSYFRLSAAGIEQGTLAAYTVWSATQSFNGPKSMPYVLPHWQGDTSHQFLAKDSDTGKPHVALAYYIETDDNKTHYGKTDKHGLTERIYSMNAKGIKVLYGADAQEKIDALVKSDKPSSDESTES